MGEIKSTLDLVMERTRHLSMSAEEKEAQQREEFDKRLQGLLQQYLDEGQSVDHLLGRLSALRKEIGIGDERLATVAVLRRIEPDRENGPWLALLERLAPETHTALQKILIGHRQRKTERLQAAQATVQTMLAQDHGIRGSAVLPNPMKDAACRNDLEALRNETRTAIEALKA
jgi:hypothetical protein